MLLFMRKLKYMLKKVVLFALLSHGTTSFCGIKPETTDKVENTGIQWNFELYNKTTYPVDILIGNSVHQNSLFLQHVGSSIPPMKKIRTVVNRAFPLAVEIHRDGKKLVEGYVMPCRPNQPCPRTVFLTLDNQGLRPQTGQWYGLKGVTDSELDITDNIPAEHIIFDWEEFVAKNKRFFQNKVYQRAQDPSVYERIKEKAGAIWQGKPQVEIINDEKTKYKNLIEQEADYWINKANEIEDPSFKKATANAIINTGKRKSIEALDQTQTVDDIKTTYDNFRNNIAHTRDDIGIAHEKVKHKNIAIQKANHIIDRANKIDSPLFKKATALAIVNTWKRKSIEALDQAQTVDEMRTILTNFDDKTANTRRAIEEAEKQR